MHLLKNGQVALGQWAVQLNRAWSSGGLRPLIRSRQVSTFAASIRFTSMSKAFLLKKRKRSLKLWLRLRSSRQTNVAGLNRWLIRRNVSIISLGRIQQWIHSIPNFWIGFTGETVAMLMRNKEDNTIQHNSDNSELRYSQKLGKAQHIQGNKHQLDTQVPGQQKFVANASCRHHLNC